MKARDAAAVRAIRSALGAIDNAESVEPSAAPPPGSHNGLGPQGLGATEAPRRQLPETAIRAIVRAEMDERRSAADEYDRLGQGELATGLRHEADVLGAHLALVEHGP